MITDLFSALPLVGEPIRIWLWGGFAVDNPTLNRFFSLHYLLPFVIAGVVVLHIWALHVPGSNPTGVEVKSPSGHGPVPPVLHGEGRLRAACSCWRIASFVFYKPNYLGHPDNYILANPLETPAHIVPEWYYLPFYAILRATPSSRQARRRAGHVRAIGVLFLLPWLDTSKVRSMRYRPGRPSSTS